MSVVGQIYKQIINDYFEHMYNMSNIITVLFIKGIEL